MRHSCLETADIALGERAGGRGRSLPARWLTLLLLVLPHDAAGGDIIVNEIMYRTETADPREEYIELFNRGTNTYNLAGWRLSQGVQFVFPSVILWPGQHLAVAADLATFTNRSPDAMNVVGGW
ncbi:MAG TPA: lamin tail domain-containing protein, partial [Verrucomicrobiota bacterium]|nr:lamin tail domain-containing protein [Verrucomicrobiota bacterium]